MPDDIRTQAATYIDGEHRRIHDDLIHEHRRQEQRMLSWEKSRLESHARNREVSQLRYAQRLRTIEERRDRIADRIQARHNSMGGRLAALTKKGREQQAAGRQQGGCLPHLRPQAHHPDRLPRLDRLVCRPQGYREGMSDATTAIERSTDHRAARSAHGST